MAFDNDNLVAVGGSTGNPSGLYFYQTDDTPATVTSDGYFDSAAERLDDNSLMLVIQNETNSSPDVDLYHVEDSAGDITLTNETLA